MTDFVALARQAREKLAAALALLQAPEAGNLIDTVAEPVAKAMGALHQIEASKGEVVMEKGPLALTAVRSALAALQSQPPSPIADQAMEHIASSLGLVHGLAQEVRRISEAPPKDAGATPEVIIPQQPTPKVASVPPGAATQPAAARQSSRPPGASPSQPPVASGRSSAGALDRTQLAPSRPPRAAGQSDPAPAAPSGALDQTLPTPTKAESLNPPISLDSTQASVRVPGQSIPAKVEPKIEAKVEKKASVPPAASARPTDRNSKHAPSPSGGAPAGAIQVEANLGAHSPTNFYKGLSGNDVVDDGGLFVATYDIPPLGSRLWVTVNMPGGYDFQALAEVRWLRESGFGDAPPGFGCSFKDISKEARQLIYRYVRNREPLFHDDL